MGFILQLVLPAPFMTQIIPALYYTEGLAAGWIIHLMHSVIFGITYAILVNRSIVLYDNSQTNFMGILQGIVFAIIIWVIFASIVMPFWLQSVGFALAPPLPNFNPITLFVHVIYGAILGFFFFPVD